MADYSIELGFAFDGLSSSLDISLASSNGTELVFDCSYGDISIELTYDQSTKTASASWEASQGQSLSIGELMSFIGLGDLASGNSFNGGLTGFDLSYTGSTGLAFIDLTTSGGDKAFLAAIKSTGTQKGWHYGFGVYLTESVSTADLPLVGKSIGNKISAKNIHLIYLSESIDQQALTVLNDQLTQEDIPSLPTQSSGEISTGLIANATLDFDNIIPAFQLSSTQVSGSNTGSSTSATQSQNQSNSNSQKSVGRNIGPVNVQSVKLGYSSGELDLTLNAAIALGPLSMSLQGLQISNPLDHFDPSFDLNGLGIYYDTGPIQLGGDFLKVLPAPSGVNYQYDGALTLGIKSFQLDAYGSYAELDDGDASFFIYALADYPLGGPAFFFVTGLAAAFGYNRNLLTPPINEVSQYPLVAAAAGNSPASSSQDAAAKTSAILAAMDEYMPAMAGEFFAGLGVKFNSFEVINAFALLTGKFGKELEFDFFALANYTAPTPQDPNPVAVVELEVLGRLIPSQGSVMVQGQLTPHSFLLDKNCHLTGGFAVGFWASGEYAGDFVYTFGGYGSHYKPPAHYPQNVPVIGLTWQINSHMSVKGGLYWAITPEIIAAGGYLKANFKASFFKAWFDLSAYFLIQWKPFHYEAGFHVDFGIKVRIDLLFTSVWLHFDMGANLQIQGPPFGGRASIHLSVCTIHIDFGSSASGPKPLSWSEFESSFLPASADRVNINLVSGLVKTTKDVDNNEVWVVNGKELCLQTNTFIPNTTYTLDYQEDGQSTTSTLPTNSPTFNKPGIKPMALASGGFGATHKLTLTGPDGSCQLKAVPILANAPKAIWDDSSSSSGGSLLSNTLKGFQLVPANEPPPGVTQAVSRNSLAWELSPISNAFQDNTLSGFSGAEATSVDQYILGTEEARNAVLTAMNLTADEIPDSTTLKQNLNFNFMPGLVNGSYSESA